MNSSEYYTRCPECESGLVHDCSKGEYICQKCGYVVMDQADYYGPESHSTDFNLIRAGIKSDVKTHQKHK